MAGFDPDDYGGYDGEDDEMYAVENAYSEANRTSRPISILLDCYKKYEDKDSIADRVANDQEALEWLDDYREYVCDVENGNEGSIEDMGGFVGFARIFSDNADAVAEYLLYDEYDEIDDDAKNLYDRLKRIASRYGGNVSKMKKSQTVAGITFDDDGVNNNPEDARKVKNEGELLLERYNEGSTGGWGYDYYRYKDIYVCIQTAWGDFIDMILLDKQDLNRAGISKSKKSIPNIHDMIAQTRANNNSLVKSRVKLNK